MVHKESDQPDHARRGRPRSYDPEAALDSALTVFWRNGFSASSLDDICRATGMNRPSVYAAFGDKRALFLKAIDRYREISRGHMRKAFSRAGPVREVLRGAYADALDLYYAGEDTPLGCFMVSAVITEAVDDEEIRSSLALGLVAFDEAFARQFERAQAAGEIPTSRDPMALARIASAALYYLAARSRAGERRETLETFVDSTIEILCS